MFERLRGLFRKKEGKEGGDTTWIGGDSSTVQNIVGYFDNLNDISQIKAHIIKRFGTGIKQEETASGTTLETYTHEEVAIQVDSEMWESIKIGYGHKIVNAQASLFSEKGSRFTLSMPDDEDADLEDVEQVLNRNRKAGGSKAALVKCDKRAIQCLSAVMFFEWRNGHLVYSCLDPGQIQIKFDEMIEENGKTRPVDCGDMEDASQIVIKTGETVEGVKTYISIFGRQVGMERGRYVVYQSRGDGKDVPPVGHSSAWDLKIDGEPANPMTIWAEDHPDEYWPEYPLAVLLGDGDGGGDVLPVSDTLHKQSLNFDVQASHLISTSGRAAAGTLALLRNQNAMALPLPRTLYGAVALGAGMDIKHLSHDAAASEAAYGTLRNAMTDDAASRGVPDYMVVSEDHTLDASSGVALAVKTRPLRMKRLERAENNHPFIEKFFKLETAFIGLFDDTLDQGLIDKLVTVEQTWETGDIKLPENKKEKTERIKGLREQGIYDLIRGIQDWYDFTTVEEAIEEYDRIKKRMKDYPPFENPLGADQGKKKPVGLLRGRKPPEQQADDQPNK